MTRLTFTGLRNGARVPVVWHDATLSGDLKTRCPDFSAMRNSSRAVSESVNPAPNAEATMP